MNAARCRQKVPLITSAEVRNLACAALQRAEAGRFSGDCLDILLHIHVDLEVRRGEAMVIAIDRHLSLRGRLSPWRHVVIIPCF